MMCPRLYGPSASPISPSSKLTTIPGKLACHSAVTVFFLFAAFACFGQDANRTKPPEYSSSQTPPADTVTIPAGTRMALVLTQPIESRYIRRGDDIYAQVNAPENSGNDVVIPPGTFVQGTVEKLARRNGRGEVQLQSMSITFPDGYVAPIPGPMTLETDEGYAIKDPGAARTGAAVGLLAGGTGIGALIGHSVGGSSSTLTNTLPPGCTGPPPGCLSSSLTVPGNAGRNTVIGAGVGGAIGGIGSLILLLSSHHFFLEAGAPVEMRLEQPVSLRQDEVSKAVQQSVEHPVAVQPAAPVPTFYPPPYAPYDHGICFTAGTPGTPSTTIPGAPGPDGIPGPPTIIPGTPATPGTPYPCP
jgi:hypothetical protein